CFPTAGRRGHQHIFGFERRQGFELKWIWFERRRLWRTDSSEQLAQFTIVGAGLARSLTPRIAGSVCGYIVRPRPLAITPPGTVKSVGSTHKCILGHRSAY